MRVYHKIEELKFDDPDKQAVIGDAANQMILLLAENFKYKIMWALRSMEKEIEECGGVIFLVSKKATDTARIELEGFTAEQGERIQRLLLASKLL